MRSEAASAVYAIATVPALRADAEACLPAIAALDVELSKKEMIDILGPLLPVFRDRRTEEELLHTWRVYYEALKEIPPAALMAARQEYVRQPVDFFPSAGKLIALAQAKLSEIRKEHRRVRVALSLPADATFEQAQEAYAASWDQAE